MGCIALIPARGGSKAILGKNLQPIAGKPLLAYTIEQALYAEAIDHVFVSTDDDQIARVARQYGAGVVPRPPTISGDTATSESALRHALDFLAQEQELNADLVVFLQCTSPLRKPDDIDNAVAMLHATGADSLLSVVPFHTFIWQQIDGKAQALDYDHRQRPRRQDRHPEFIENGSIYVFKPSVLFEHDNRLGGEIALYPMHEWSLIDINEQADLDLCRLVLPHFLQTHGDVAAI